MGRRYSVPLLSKQVVQLEYAYTLRTHALQLLRLDFCGKWRYLL